MRTHWLLPLAFLLPSPAGAIIGEDHWISGQNQILAAQLAESGRQTAQLLRLVTETRNMLSAANETAAFARVTWRQIKLARHYSLDQMLEDAQKGFYKAFPELKELDVEARAMAGNLGAGWNGEFWDHRDHHDRRSDKHRRRIEYLLKGQIWPVANTRLYKADAADAKLDAYFKSTGQAGRRAVHAASYVAFTDRVKVLSAQAAQSENLQVHLDAHTAEMATQTTRNTTELLMHKEAETAIKQDEREDARAFSKGFLGALRKLGRDQK